MTTPSVPPGALGAGAVAVGLALATPAAAAIDVNALWDFARPEVSEARFRDAARGAQGDDLAILQTQIARTWGLRRDFARAQALLAELAPRLPTLGVEARARYHLELGRTLVSATHKPAERTPEARAAARAEYLRAAELARGAGLDALAIDALHMLPFVETDPAAEMRWNEEALALALASPQPAARRWEASLRNNIGVTLKQTGRLDEALAMFQAALAARQAQGDAGRIRIAHWMIAWTLRAMGRLDEALAIQLRLERENAEAGTPDEYVFEELAALHAAKGDRAQAARYEALRRQAAGAR